MKNHLFVWLKVYSYLRYFKTYLAYTTVIIPANVCVIHVQMSNMLNVATSVFVSVGREGRGDSLSPEWHTLHWRRAGPLPSLCTAGLLPAIQP